MHRTSLAEHRNSVGIFPLSELDVFLFAPVKIFLVRMGEFVISCLVALDDVLANVLYAKLTKEYQVVLTFLRILN